MKLLSNRFTGYQNNHFTISRTAVTLNMIHSPVLNRYDCQIVDAFLCGGISVQVVQEMGNKRRKNNYTLMLPSTENPHPHIAPPQPPHRKMPQRRKASEKHTSPRTGRKNFGRIFVQYFLLNFMSHFITLHFLNRSLHSR